VRAVVKVQAQPGTVYPPCLANKEGLRQTCESAKPLNSFVCSRLTYQRDAEADAMERCISTLFPKVTWNRDGSPTAQGEGLSSRFPASAMPPQLHTKPFASMRRQHLKSMRPGHLCCRTKQAGS
jgi:hypothetical protein